MIKPVEGHDAFVRRLSFRAFGRMQAAAASGQAAGDTPGAAFAIALAAACGCNEDGEPMWAGYDEAAEADWELVQAVALAASAHNGLDRDDDAAKNA